MYDIVFERNPIVTEKPSIRFFYYMYITRISFHVASCAWGIATVFIIIVLKKYMPKISKNHKKVSHLYRKKESRVSPWVKSFGWCFTTGIYLTHWPLGDAAVILKCNFHIHITDRCREYILGNSHVNVTWPHWWLINTGSGNGCNG